MMNNSIKIRIIQSGHPHIFRVFTASKWASDNTFGYQYLESGKTYSVRHDGAEEIREYIDKPEKN